ncbi:hypothetical protein TorRG33x02_321600 [Trema orientale]|uniref:Uncharacterized protein n=1 Tax=Trema orientale TaxID=63057 RepID=A0A2P5BGT3_TREOI|nr:hypothetical protein TorRG33x02_321600 [Trema orientale]
MAIQSKTNQGLKMSQRGARVNISLRSLAAKVHKHSATTRQRSSLRLLVAEIQLWHDHANELHGRAIAFGICSTMASESSFWH